MQAVFESQLANIYYRDLNEWLHILTLALLSKVEPIKEIPQAFYFGTLKSGALCYIVLTIFQIDISVLSKQATSQVPAY